MNKRESLSLLDIAPRSEMVAVNEEQSLRVRGLSAESIKQLLIRFPSLQGIIMGVGVSAQTILNLGPEIVGAVCAAATGGLGNPEAEDMARDLPIETQLDVLEALGRCTFSKGFGPFAQRVMVIAKVLSGPAGKAPPMTSPPESPPLEEQPTQTSGS